MFEKKLDAQDLLELQKRTELINSYVLVAQALEMQKNMFLRNLISKYGLRGDINYQFDLKGGKIKKAKEQPQPQQQRPIPQPQPKPQ